MRSRSDLWALIAARGEFDCETKLVINGTEYTEITAPVIERNAMPEGLSVGNCCCASLQVSIDTEDTIPKSACVDVYTRISNEKGISEWLQMGRFFISKRYRTYDGMIDLTCYDAMMKANQTFTNSDKTSWGSNPKTPQQAVIWIADKIGVFIDQRVNLINSTTYSFAFPEGKTYKEVLEAIAAEHGGNFFITNAGLLMLCVLTTIPDETFNVVDNDYENIIAADGTNLTWREYPDIGRERVTDGVVNVPVVLGELNTGEITTINGIKLTDAYGHTFIAGDIEDGALVIENNPLIAKYNGVLISRELFSAFNGVSYAPFTATQCIMDPAIEIGDRVKIGDKVLSVVYNIVFTLGDMFSADLVTHETDEDEYPYIGKESASAQEVSTTKITVGSSNTSISSDDNSDIVFKTANNQTSIDAILSRIAALENS